MFLLAHTFYLILTIIHPNAGPRLPIIRERRYLYRDRIRPNTTLYITPPDQDPLVSGLGLSLFRSICTARASYSRQKLSAPFAFFVLLVPYYIQHGFLWASQKFLLYTSGRYKILVKSLLTVRNGKPKNSGL